jgi:hypothetical protein
MNKHRVTISSPLRTGGRLPAVLLGVAVAIACGPAIPDDIDLFTPGSGALSPRPNVLIVLDNTSNWAALDQKWPDKASDGSSLQQGQSEVAAIRAALGAVSDDINIGLMEIQTGGNASNTGGYVRYHIRQMTDANKAAFQAELDEIFPDINDPEEKRNTGEPYGSLMHDVYNYLAGLRTETPGGTLATKADPDGYDDDPTFDDFNSPLIDVEACARTFIIFIGNPQSSGPTDDTATNTNALEALKTGASTQLRMPKVKRTDLTKVGYTSGCFTSKASCESAGFSAFAACGGNSSCTCDSEDTKSELAACQTGKRYDLEGQNTKTDVASPVNVTGTSACYTTQSACQTAEKVSGTGVCPAATDNGGSGAIGDPKIAKTYSCTMACDNATKTVSTCGKTADSSVVGTPLTPTTSLTNKCYNVPGNDANNANAYISGNNSSDHGTLTCPAATNGGTTENPTTTTYACSYKWSAPDSNSTVAGGSCTTASNQFNAGSGNFRAYTVTQTATPTTTTYTQAFTFPLSGTYTETTKTTTTSRVGNTFECYATATDASAATAPFTGFTDCSDTTKFSAGCKVNTAKSTTIGSCPDGSERFAVLSQTGIPDVQAVQPTAAEPDVYDDASAVEVVGTNKVWDLDQNNADEWAKFLHTTGVKVGDITHLVSTYTIDVYYQAPSEPTTSLFLNMASVSGGKYYAAHSGEDVTEALLKILTEIQAVNSAFASASLPVNATNRAQDKNQVFIGMFRPTKDASPRWYGNLKQYQLILSNGRVDLGDVNKESAVSSTTGFVNDCAISFWTADTDNYWQFTDDTIVNPITSVPYTPDGANEVAKSGCKLSGTELYSDSPDGPLVEKGAAAEIIRNGNNPGSSATFSFNRTLYTLTDITADDATAMATFNSGNVTSIDATLVDFARGIDVDDHNQNGKFDDTRPSIHGDVVHSRPQPVDFGTGTGVIVFYGSNDGMFHAVQAEDGKELWAFVAPEFITKLERLKDNCPLISYPKKVPVGSCTDSDGSSRDAAAKDYFFDGSVGLYESADATPTVWVYPSMRRGGRMMYAFDVTTPSAPKFKWKFGCPYMTNDNDCTTHTGDKASPAVPVTAIGQTWSTPDVAFIDGYDPNNDDATPVIILGGGNDPPSVDPPVKDTDRGCEDRNEAPATCADGKGHGVYVLDAFTGKLLNSFKTDRSVVADMALLDANFDGKADYAYVVDMGGNAYRIDFVKNDSARSPLAPDDWKIHKIAYTSVGNRRFEFAPALVQATSTTIYLAIGSGDREHPLICQYPFPTDEAGTDTCADGVSFPGVANRFYVFTDSLSSTSGAIDIDDCAGGTMANYTNGLESAKTCESTAATTPTADCGTEPILPTSKYKGWFIDLIQNGNGEQTVTSAVVAGGLVFFSTNRPQPPAKNSCKSDLGEARGYSLNLLTAAGNLGKPGQICGGDRSAIFLGGGLPPSPVLATVPIGSEVKTVLIGAVQNIEGGGGIQSEIGAQEKLVNIKSKRRAVYWYKTPGGDTD